MQNLETIRDDMSLLTDWEDKYSYIIELGKNIPILDEGLKRDEFKISGCVSQVWLVHEEQAGKHYFKVDSDALIVKGLLGLLMVMYNEKTSEDILKQDANAFLNELGMASHLSPNRRNGFAAVTDKIRSYAA